MITEALLHCPGIGPARLARLHASGVRTWEQVMANLGLVPTGLRDGVQAECMRCVEALERGDVAYFVRHFAPSDRWRILRHFLEDVSFFDIETAGLEYDDPITVIACWHRGRLQTFVEHENLDGFLDVLSDVRLLGSFNGSSFDVPRVLSTFHIPDLPCAHLDLRWLCYHFGMRGGLKEISQGLGIERPSDLREADGALAVRLWARWEHFRDQGARDLLLRYCASDVLLLRLLSEKIVGSELTPTEQVWGHLPRAATDVPVPIGAHMPVPRAAVPSGAFGEASPSRLRARWPLRR